MNKDLLKQLENYGVGHRKHNDQLFADDKPPPKYGIHDFDDENLCHEVVKISCHIFGCGFTGDTLLDFENHYNAVHRYSCAQCKKMLPSPHLLDLHIQETHDSFFAVMAERRPSYVCYLEECKEKFLNPQDRLYHCIKLHKLPKDYRFEQTHQKGKKPQKKIKNKTETNENSMEVEEKNKTETNEQTMEVETPEFNRKERSKKFAFANNKQKVFYSGKKFTNNSKENKQDVNVNIDAVMEDLRDSLPS